MPFALDDDARTSVRRHFRRKDFEWSEDYFLRVLETAKRKSDIYWAAIALRDCGTARSIPVLVAKLYYPVQDVKCVSMLTIAQVARASGTELYGRALLDPKYPDKGYAMWAIAEVADHRAVDPVLAYLRKNLSKIRRGKLHSGTLPFGLRYLQKFSDMSAGIRDLFVHIESCWDHLTKDERTLVSGFLHGDPAHAPLGTVSQTRTPESDGEK